VLPAARFNAQSFNQSINQSIIIIIIIIIISLTNTVDETQP